MNSEFKTTPFIRLQGKWLTELGFEVGTQFVAEIENKRIILKLNEEIK